MHWHWHRQNLNETGKFGGAIREGRAWLHLQNQRETVLGISWHMPTDHWMASVTVGPPYGDNDLTFGFGCGLFDLWLHSENLLPRKWLPEDGRETSLAIHGGGLWWSAWKNENEWKRSDSKWMHGNFNVVDFLFGKQIYSTVNKPPERTTVALPEAVYPATVVMFTSTWKRPRWPWPQRLVRATITPDTPIPIPGKGENSWDIGDDAIHELTCPASNRHDAAQRLAESVMRSRQRYGGASWEPASPAGASGPAGGD